ncbi:MAG: ATP-binding protein [Verrucomicrobiales bacterium]|nr:ATP-binding protein [Verrucomicrobiales bacterium]
MKLFKSIKWRLQIWYGLILVVVLAGFGFTSYQLERGRQFRRIDDELHQRLEVLKNALHRQQPRGPNGNRPFPGQSPRRQNLNEPPPGGPPPGQFPEEDPLGLGARPPGKFSLPEDAEHFFEASDPHEFYFSIMRDDKEIAKSMNQRLSMYVTSTYFGGPVNQLANLPGNTQRPQNVHSIENYREIYQHLPAGDFILVGCSVLPELNELQHTALNLTAVGGLILLVGLAGGAWLVSRSLKPISSISATAVKISAGDLSQRINVAEAESELGQLAAVLNSTFARLETAFAQQKQFASDAAHELRTPVSVMLTQTQTALNRERDAASYKLTVEACQRAAQRMRKLIESLLALARFDAGQEVLKRMPFDLFKTISDCAELVQPLAEERAVKVFIEAGPLEITGDPERLAQVVTNLLTNAIQYNQPEGEVRVKLESQNGLAVLTVTDTGQGIAAEDVPRVFGRFYRADQSRTGAGNTGLGLAISKAIVEAHGGTIEVASEENVKTTFTVRLPV